MGMGLVDAAVEVKREKSRPKTFLNLDGLFGLTPPQWKIFLLGHGKYGPRDFLAPEKPIRGVPERAMRSDWTWNLIEKYEGFNVEEISEKFTYYTLNELEEIDLSDPVFMPDNPSKSSELKYSAKIYERKSGEWQITNNSGKFTVDQIMKGLNSSEPVEITLQNKGETKKIRVERRKKKEYAEGFYQLIDTINRIYENQAFEFKHARHQEISKEDIRMMIAADID